MDLYEEILKEDREAELISSQDRFDLIIWLPFRQSIQACEATGIQPPAIFDAIHRRTVEATDLQVAPINSSLKSGLGSSMWTLLSDCYDVIYKTSRFC